MIPKLAVMQIQRALPLLAVGMLLGVSPSFAEPVTFGSSGFSLGSLTPVSLTDPPLTPPPPSATFRVAIGGYFVISSGASSGTIITGGLAGGGSSLGPQFLYGSGGSGTTSGGAPSSGGWDHPVTGSSSLDSSSGTFTPAVTPVPEPSTVCLVGLGLFLFSMRSYFRNHVARPHSAGGK
jgi:hypothetical protein